MIETFFALIIIVVIGFIVLKIFHLSPYQTMLENIPFAFGLGGGLVAAQLYIYSRVGIAWYMPQLLIPWLILFVFFLTKYRNFDINNIIPKLVLNMCGKWILVLSFTVMIFTGFEAMLRPVSAWDAWAIWLLKSKVFFIDSTVDPNVFKYLNSEYPIFLSLIGTFFYIVMGRVDDLNIMLLFFAFYLFLGIGFFVTLREYMNDNLAIIFTFLLISTQNILRHGGRFEGGQADLALSFYIFISVCLLLKYLKNQKHETIILLSILLAITSLIKYEGHFIILTVQAVLFVTIFIKKKYLHLFFTVFSILPAIDWQLFKSIYNIQNNYILQSGSFYLERLPKIILLYIDESVNFLRWNLIWPVFIISIFRTNNIIVNTLYIIFISQLGFYTFIYFITPLDYIAQINSSLDRLLIHIVPIAVFIIALRTNDLISKINYNTVLKSILIKHK